MVRIEAEPNGAADTGPTACGVAAIGRGMARQERRQMRLDADRSHAGAAAAMRNAEGLVQIEMADIGAVIAGPRQPDLRIHVGAVEIDLPAMAMHDVADLADVLLEHAVGGGIGDHDGGEIFGVLRRLGARDHSTSTSPLLSQATTTTSMPAMLAEAGLVPCAEEGIRQTLRCASPRAA